MSTAASGLRELHQLHVQMENVRHKLERGPKQIEARQRVISQKEQEITEKQEQLKQLRMQADQKSLQLKINEQKIIDIKVKLNSASSNREFEIFKTQIEADSMANSVLEDEILEALDKVDEMQQSIQQSEEALAQAKADENRVTGEVADAKTGLEDEIAKLQSALESAETVIPVTVMEQYRRLIQAHGADALASVEHKACNGCHSILSPQCCVNVNVGKFVYCRGCGRLLYNSDES